MNNTQSEPLRDYELRDKVIEHYRSNYSDDTITLKPVKWDDTGTLISIQPKSKLMCNITLCITNTIPELNFIAKKYEPTARVDFINITESGYVVCVVRTSES